MSRRPDVTVTLVSRVCDDCGRVGLDVLAGPDGARCYPGAGCNTKARALAEIAFAGVTLADVGRAKRSLARVEAFLRKRGAA